MIVLDHLILRVRDAQAAVLFYQRVLGFAHEGQAGPFEVLRVNEGLTVDLLQTAPQDSQHLAFALDREAFDAAHRRLIDLGIAFGSGPFERASATSGRSLGARGMADALYFCDPDQHNIEIRTYDSSGDTVPRAAATG